MKNVQIDVDKDKIMTVKIDLKERMGKSASGKTIIVASTEGNIEVPGYPEIRLGINAYTK